MISGAALAAIAAGFFYVPTPLIRYGIVWTASSLALALNLTGVGENVFAERYLYLPSVGFCWIAAWVWDKLSNRNFKLAVAAGVVLLTAFAVRTLARNRDWKDDLTLFQA